MDRIVAAASAALGERLTDPVDLGGASRSTVLRCRRASGDTVIVKAYKAETTDGFAAESAGLAFADRRLPGIGPRPLAVDETVPLVVMTDLGSWPSLADTLLHGEADAAHDALLAWALAYARIAVASIGAEADFGHRSKPWPSQAAALHAALAAFGVPAPAGLAADLAEVERPGGYEVFSPGDICPDNNLFTADGMRVLDFEGAGYHSVFLDAAYTRMPFASCWCVFELPQDVRTEISSAYRGEIVRGYPALADDGIWLAGLRRAMARWTIHITTTVAPRVIEADRPTHRVWRPVPSRRQLLRFRWAALVDELAPTGELPALTEAFLGLLAVTEDWRVEPLPPYPPFAGLSQVVAVR